MLDNDYIHGRHKKGWKLYYSVLLDGVVEFDGLTLSRCLQYIGTSIHGERFGCGNVRASYAASLGYSIVTMRA